MEVILKDIFRNARTFLPGQPCTPTEVQAHLVGSILIDGLNEEESALILSTLPRGSDRIYLSPLDKGLSGSKVFGARYELHGKPVSREFVVKVGPRKKLEREAEAMQTLAAPYIRGVAAPVFRCGPSKAAIVQELAGVDAPGTLTSLRYYAQSSKKAGELVRRLLGNRLWGWYGPAAQRPQMAFRLSELFRWYLTKASKDDLLPERWRDLRQWIVDGTGIRWPETETAVRKLLASERRYPAGIAHGDLHSQNVLVDQHGEVWPIDFAWTYADSSPIVDLVMLECSLKFLAIPRRSDLRMLISLEYQLALNPSPRLHIGHVPYCEEIRNVTRGILALRQFAIRELQVPFEAYRSALATMTFCLAGHPELNRPYVIASTAILLSLQ